MTTENENTGATGTEEDLSTDFNLDTDYKPNPLVPNGTYDANVVDVQFKADKACIQWKVTLDGNGGYLSDGETAIDGVQLYFNNWLPKKGDESTPTPSGKSTKFQAKVNQLKEFGDAMKLNLNTLAVIKEQIENGDFIGIACKVTVGTKEYPEGSGRFSNEISRMIAA